MLVTKIILSYSRPRPPCYNAFVSPLTFPTGFTKCHTSHSSGSPRLLDALPFPIYYNDVYEVDLPPGHRFPMWKYRKVRESFQAQVVEDQNSGVYCGKMTTKAACGCTEPIAFLIVTYPSFY